MNPDEVYAFLEAQASQPAMEAATDQAKAAYEELTHLAVHALEAERDDDKAAFVAATLTASKLIATLDRNQLILALGCATADLAEAVIREGRHVRIEVDPAEEE